MISETYLTFNRSAHSARGDSHAGPNEGRFTLFFSPSLSLSVIFFFYDDTSVLHDTLDFIGFVSKNSWRIYAICAQFCNLPIKNARETNVSVQFYSVSSYFVVRANLLLYFRLKLNGKNDTESKLISTDWEEVKCNRALRAMSRVFELCKTSEKKKMYQAEIT